MQPLKQYFIDEKATIEVLFLALDNFSPNLRCLRGCRWLLEEEVVCFTCQRSILPHYYYTFPWSKAENKFLNEILLSSGLIKTYGTFNHLFLQQHWLMRSVRLFQGEFWFRYLIIFIQLSLKHAHQEEIPSVFIRHIECIDVRWSKMANCLRITKGHHRRES